MADNETKTDESKLEAAMKDFENERFEEFDSIESLMQDLNNGKQSPSPHT